jgi:ribonuclease HI
MRRTSLSSHACSALQAETEAFVAAVEGAAALSLNRVFFQSDSKVMVDALNSSSHELSEIGVLLRDTRSLCIASFDLFCFKHCRRVCNKIAHTLAKFDSQADEECVGWADESQTLYLIWSPASLLRPLSNGNPLQC